MNHWRSQHFMQLGQANGISDAALKNASSIANAFLAKSPQLPPLFTLRHIAHETTVPYSFLHKVVGRENCEEHYRIFKLKKQNVGHSVDRFRYICAPHPLLLKAQRWIHKEILSKITPNESSFAYSSGVGILDAAKMHTSCKWLIKLDVTNFFESILEPDIFKVFSELGYQPLVAFELARICTRTRVAGNPMQKKMHQSKNQKFPYKNEQIGHLPQGAATSPVLANLASRALDEALLNYSQLHGLSYTRYADDLTFSSCSKFDRSEALAHVHKIYELMREQGLWPNKAKTKIIPPGARKLVLGLLVDGENPCLKNEFKSSMRTHIHFLLRSDIGPELHAKNRGFDSILGLQRHLHGLLAYAIGIEPIWARSSLNELKKVNWPKYEGFQI